MSKLLLSPKYKSFIRSKANVEFLEGTTMAGKTTVGLFKFILKCAQSEKRLHVLAAKDIGTAEKNIINKELGIIDDFGDLTEYNGGGTNREKIPHILLHTSSGDKTIYVMGYGDRQKWQKALGGQYGCLYIDEINTADIDFVREAMMRADYTMATLNPDDPSLDVYKEYINHSRPLPEWEQETPREILGELTAESKPGWVHWFFSFEHNLGLKQSELERVLQNTPKGTKIYKNKVLGLRGRATGLVFNNFDTSKHVKSAEWAKQFIKTSDRKAERFIQFTSGMDTAYSSKSEDSIAMTFAGITSGGKLIVLSEKYYNNKDTITPIAPSDNVRNYFDFLNRNRETWGFSRKGFIDSADQATITEAVKFKRNNACVYNFEPAWKKMKIIDRIELMLGWIQTGNFYVLDACPQLIRELGAYAWKEDKDNEPEDRNDHFINSVQYAWLPYRSKIGDVTKSGDFRQSEKATA
jgi:PBSX family phage terminase large subunit